MADNLPSISNPGFDTGKAKVDAATVRKTSESLGKMTGGEVTVLDSSDPQQRERINQVLEVVNNPELVPIIYHGSKKETEEKWFIRLGYFLELIRDEIMYKVVSDGSTDVSNLINFDIDEESNLMYVEELQTSVNPDICVINKETTIGSTKYNFMPAKAVGPLTSPPKTFLSETINILDEKGNKVLYGKIMNIYVNMKHILLLIDSSLDPKDNSLVLIKFLNDLLTSISGALGGVNSLEINIDEITNTLMIRDANPMPFVDEVIKQLQGKYLLHLNTITFDLYGYKNNSTAGFIKDFSLTTELSPELSTMMTVAATSNSNTVGEDTTAFSKFNYGLEDRFKKEMYVGLKPTDEKNEDKLKEYEDLKQRYTQTFTNYIEYLNRIQIKDNSNESVGSYSEEEGTSYQSALTDFLTARKQYTNEVYKQTLSKLNIAPTSSLLAPHTGFIPFNMSITMDGLSGMKIYSKFNIDTDYLPSNYSNSAEFLIRGVEHNIENNKWTTKLESMIVSKGKDKLKTSSNKSDKSGEKLYKGSVKLSEADTISFLTDILKGLGILIPNSSQIKFLKIWRQAEGGKAAWNPFNTTLNRPGALSYNSNEGYPVKNYTSRAQGLEATISTIKSSRYITLRQKINTIKNDFDINAAMSALDKSPWGTHFSKPINYNNYVTFNNFLYADPIV